MRISGCALSGRVLVHVVDMRAINPCTGRRRRRVSDLSLFGIIWATGFQLLQTACKEGTSVRCYDESTRKECLLGELELEFVAFKSFSRMIYVNGFSYR